MAAIESIYNQKGWVTADKLNTLIKDPTRVDKFIKSVNEDDSRLEMDHFVPDQFVPLYWASLWLIIINTIVGGFLFSNADSAWRDNPANALVPFFTPVLFSSICLPFIWKIWDYYLYKLKGFVDTCCDFRITVCSEGRDFFESQDIAKIIMLFIMIFATITIPALLFKEYNFSSKRWWLLILSLIVTMYFVFPVAIGILLHLFKHIFQITSASSKADSCLKRLFNPQVIKRGARDGKDIFKLTIGRFRQFLLQLYIVI